MSAKFPFDAATTASFTEPIILQRAEILAHDDHFFARVSSGKSQGIVALGRWTPALVSLWQSAILPFWVGRDARDLDSALEEIIRTNQNPALAGAPFWMAVAAIELAIWDLLGQISGQTVAALLTEKPRPKTPVYLASARRARCEPGAARQEIEDLAELVVQTGARAAAIQIGPRAPDDENWGARDRELLTLARQNWGDKFTVYADANGSLDVEKAIEVGALLHDFKVAWFEEPCQSEDFEAMRAVSASVQLPVAGGRHESSWFQWKWRLENCALDIARPDLFAGGGLLRSLRLAHFAAQLGVSSAPHAPGGGPLALPIVHFCAAIEKPAPFLEWHAVAPAPPAWCQTPLELKKGALALPKTPGWGAIYDQSLWKRAETLTAAGV